MELALRTYLAGAASARALRARLADEVGEGVISTAIAVLIMALIGLAMWTLFDQVFTNAGEDIRTNVDNIGGGGGGAP